MRAVVYEKYGGPEVLHVKEIPQPVPKSDEVLVKVSYAMVSAGDCRMRSMKLDDIRPLERFFAKLVVGVRKPKRKILGLGLVGEIVATGKQVTRFKVSDTVVAGTWPGMRFGAYAEYAVLKEKGVLVPKPQGLSDSDALAAVAGISAVSFLRKGRIQKGERVLVYGASGAVGLTALQLAKHFGTEVTAVCSGKNHSLVKSLGADRVLDYTREDFRTGDRKYDLVFDAVGKIGFPDVRSILAKQGRYVSVITSGHAASGVKEMDFLLQLAAEGKVNPVIDKTYPLEEVVAAHEYVDSGRKRGAVLLSLSSFAM